MCAKIKCARKLIELRYVYIIFCVDREREWHGGYLLTKSAWSAILGYAYTNRCSKVWPTMYLFVLTRSSIRGGRVYFHPVPSPTPIGPVYAS